MKSPVTILLLGLVLAGAANAARQEVTLDVPGMTCPACPITIKLALSRVDGVLQADVDYDRREARVTFDDSRTTPDVLIQATTNAGYPSSIKQ